MNRRKFIQNTTIATSAVAVSGVAATSSKVMSGKHEFKLKYAPHFGMFRHNAGEDLVGQLQFMADQGFTALEDNSMKDRDTATQEKNWGNHAQTWNANGGVCSAQNLLERTQLSWWRQS
ncbi:MAG: twin-arginine translocation signal domain-containing protein [Saprospiraceae bacterium]|nr:twin-arginine translocation signal domain-containing protein [Saprospiraceae bacterium]